MLYEYETTSVSSDRLNALWIILPIKYKSIYIFGIACIIRFDEMFISEGQTNFIFFLISLSRQAHLFLFFSGTVRWKTCSNSSGQFESSLSFCRPGHCRPLLCIHLSDKRLKCFDPSVTKWFIFWKWTDNLMLKISE